MNFEDYQKAWQSQDAVPKAAFNATTLLREVRRNQGGFRRTIFWRDAREVGVAFVLTWYFIQRGLRTAAWTDGLVGLACFGVGAFMVVDRLIQRKRQPVVSDSLADCVTSSLRQVNHQIWLLRNVFWWYLLPLSAALGVSLAVSGWHERDRAARLAVWAACAVLGGLLNWFLHWLNQMAVNKTLMPRKHELEALQAEMGLPVQASETKNHAMKTTIILSVLLVAMLAVGVLLAAGPTSPAPVRASSLESIRKQNGLPALAVVVVKNGQICERQAVGWRKWGGTAPVTTNDCFHIGSCTKSMTATLAARLIEAGQLRWDTTIAEVFPELRGRMNPLYEAVTVEQLMHHRGGVPGEPPTAAWTRAWKEIGTPTEQRREFVEAVLSQPPEAAPGAKMIYSNQGYAILGAMLEKLTGQPFEALMRDKLFQPLHMETAGFGPPGTADQTDQPWGHTRKLLMTIPLQLDNPPAIAPAGRVHCSLDDLARFVTLHLQRQATNGLLRPETLARLHAPTAGGDYACGWVVLERDWAGGTALMHNGSNTMWYIVMWLAPDKDFAVIAATNIAGAEAERGCDDACVAMIHQWLPQ